MTNLSTKDTGRGLKDWFPIVVIHFEPQKEDILSTTDKTTDFILSLMCPLFEGSTVYKYNSQDVL